MSFSNAICLSGSQGQERETLGISNELFISHLLLRDSSDTVIVFGTRAHKTGALGRQGPRLTQVTKRRDRVAGGGGVPQSSPLSLSPRRANRFIFNKPLSRAEQKIAASIKRMLNLVLFL